LPIPKHFSNDIPSSETKMGCVGFEHGLSANKGKQKALQIIVLLSWSWNPTLGAILPIKVLF
jgi:hypothetical protein